MKKMNNKKDCTALAALLDGEMRNTHQIEALTSELERDAALKAEFEEQRGIKSLLAGLPEYDAPVFLATRVVGEISTRRRQHSVWLKPVAISASAVLVLVMALTTATQLLGGNGTNKLSIDLAITNPESHYTPQDWRSIQRPEGLTDERVLDFLEFASEAHAYKSMVRNADMMSPDMAEAVLVLDSSGGN